jgi:hypothetical protein
MKEAWVNAFTLQSELSTCAAQLAPELTYSKRNLYHQLVVQQQPVYVMLHALHQQCCLVLNASLVPHFSGLPVAPGMPVEVVRVSAAIAMRSAKTLSDMSADLVALEWDPTQIAPFVGYCMYVAASIHLAVLPQEGESEPQNSGWENLTKCLRLLKLMKQYWAVLDRLVCCIPIFSLFVTSRLTLRLFVVGSYPTTVRRTGGQLKDRPRRRPRGTDQPTTRHR